MIGTGDLKKAGDQLVRGACLIAAAVSASSGRSTRDEEIIRRARQFESYVREGK